MKLFYVVLYPSPGYWRHFTVMAKDARDAVNKINHQARGMYAAIKEKARTKPDGYEASNMERTKHIINATRRYRRKHRSTWAHRESRFCEVYELPPTLAYEGHLEVGGATDRTMCVWNILPKVSL